MNRFIDLHCHYVPRIDDGARSLEESMALLSALQQIGFSTIYATPHMRPGMFDNDANSIRYAFEQLRHGLTQDGKWPNLGVSAEHYFDDVVFRRILTDEAIPYPGGRAILIEFQESDFPLSIEQRLADIKRRGITPIIAHPERYNPISKAPESLELLNDVGAEALLDLAALVGKYGRRAKKTAEALMERGLYAAACSDAHRPEDVAEVAKGIEWVVKHYGQDELVGLLVDGPMALLG